jgi:hypothetical protein
MEPRKRLADILQLNSDAERLKKAWEKTEAADDFAPLPSGEYTCRVLSGELFNAKKGTPGYKLTFEVAEGEYTDRRVWHDLWLTPQALPMSKRDLAKLGVIQLEQLEQPLPPGILVKLKLALRKDDQGNDHNRVRSFEPIGIEKGDAYTPPEDEDADPSFDAKQIEREAASGPPGPASHQETPALFNGTADGGTGPYGGDRRS